MKQKEDRPFFTMWCERFKYHPQFIGKRLKKLDSDNFPDPYDIDRDIYDIVTMEEYLKQEDDRIPIIHTCIENVFEQRLPCPLTHWNEYAELHVSLLSGIVVCLEVYTLKQGHKNDLMNYTMIEFKNEK
ncbi:hypothetical protein NMK71_04815 [Weeksellaceae bacterium KMM 9713]|uniref:Uncharacterized protein n=1 Tax=Profundicola chukchiensis TaxID=2961959 RepID=A0A9X4MY83_9FLAO|nr:hypothetical protein [Profundicola chukchiensis]MDG4945727.1 hypothetical protein [Profundicola chukchiensis]